MPRTAITTALKHDRKTCVLIAGKSVSLLDQRKNFQQMKAPPLMHSDFCEVSYQESDGPEHVIRFRSPKDQAAHDAERAAEKKRQDEFAAKANTKIKHRASPSDLTEAKPKLPAPPQRGKSQTQAAEITDAPEGN
jgi:hypothetical protein